jgi:myo-inositol-1(or 4)-monophosphatase
MNLNPWDWGAGSLFIQEAGGRVSDMSGADWTMGENRILASNGTLHEELLALFARARRSQGH